MQLDPAKKPLRMCIVIEGEKRDPENPGFTVPHLFHVRRPFAGTPELLRPIEDRLSRYFHFLLVARRVGKEEMFDIEQALVWFFEGKFKDWELYGEWKKYKTMLKRAAEAEEKGMKNKEN